MNKDLFENRIGEALRGAESTPPSGAWDFIKSQIPTQYTPPFKFPTWAVVGVASSMLAGMSLMETTPNEPEIVAESASNEVFIEIVSDDSSTETNPQIGGLEPQQELTKSFSIEENVKAFIQNEENTEEINQPEIEEQQSITAEVEPAELIVLAEPQEEVETLNTRNNTQPLESVQSVPDNISSPSAAQEEASVTNEIQEDALAKQFSVEGPKECFTPCKLNLQAIGTAADYSWQAGIHGTAEGNQFELSVDEPQTIVVFANAEFKDGSEEIISHKIEVKQGSGLFIPNSFSPNGDGFNDAYGVSGTGIVEFSLTIVNSKGKVIHQATDMANKWVLDGVSSEMEGEIYIAVVRARGIDGKVYQEDVRLTINPN